MQTACHFVLLFALIFVVVGCISPMPQVHADSALGIEQQLIVELARPEEVQRMDHDQVANFFVESGEAVNSGGAPVQGRFEASWVQVTNGQYRLARMLTSPDY